jgi:hypothetical protein
LILSALDKMSRLCRQHSKRGFIAKISRGPDVKQRLHDRHAEKLREEFTLARIERHSSQFEGLDGEGILAFTERVLPRAANLWVQVSLEQRQRFQQLFFPEGNCTRRKRLRLTP